MKRIALTVIGFLGSILVANAGEWSMATGDEVATPTGYTELCKTDAYVCNSVSDVKSIILSPSIGTALFMANYTVNHAIKYMSDYEQYGVEEKWVDTPANNQGDCEDYVLTKKRILLDMGFPASALLITTIYGKQTVAGQEVPFGHAVLILVTDQGDYVMDNYYDEIYAWQDTTYPFYARQSQFIQDKFVRIVKPTDAEE